MFGNKEVEPAPEPFVYPGLVEQGTSGFPINYVEEDDYLTTLDPYNINMYLEYGPIDIFDDDRSIAKTERNTYTGWYFRPKIDGATISLFEGDVIVMYVQIENPAWEDEYESWSCSTTYEMRNTVYVGQVYNYGYGGTSLANDAVERDSANLKDQTTGHPEYLRNGPWMAASSLDWYRQEFDIERNYASVTCTAIRQYGDSQKGFFDLPVGDTVKLKMGFRVYDNETATKARIHRDYTDGEFLLLGSGKKANPLAGGAISTASLSFFALATTVAASLLF